MKLKLVCLLSVLATGLILSFIVNFHSANINQFRNAKFEQNGGLFKMTDSNLKALEIFSNMELYLRMTTRVSQLSMFYDKLLVQSLRYFWPFNLSLVVVLDNERLADHEFGNEIQKTFPFPRICFMDTLNIYGYLEKDRMQRDMLYPEQCTSKKYVAFIETDTLFITKVIPESLFADGKPVIIGIYGYILDDIWDAVARSTTNIFKTKEVVRCHASFPIILKVEHIVKLREYIKNLHNMSFDEILFSKKTAFFSQFNLMCQYVWMFHRSEYKFHLQYQPNKTKSGPVVSAREDNAYYKRELTAEQKQPFPRITCHYKYIGGNWKSQETYKNILKRSICFAGGFELCPDECQHYDKNALRKQMFYFDSIDWRWDKRCLEAQKQHYNDVENYASLEYSVVVRDACKEINHLKWNP